MPSSDRRSIEQIKLGALRPHPLQHDYYDGDTSDEDDAALAADLRERGLRDPIVVMPPGNKAGLPAYTILDGHRRARLLAANGETDADVLIRHDLADADAAIVEAEFLRYNSVRRQLHTIDKARIALRLYEIEKGRSRGKLILGDEEREARDRVGAAIGMSGRNLHRYFRLLLTPLEIQRAVRDGKLRLVDAEKVEGLTEAVQEEIAERIRDGEEPKVVVQEYIAASRPGKGLGPVDALARHLRRGLEAYAGRTNPISAWAVARNRETLHEAQQLIGELLDRSDDGDPWADLRGSA